MNKFLPIPFILLVLLTFQSINAQNLKSNDRWKYMHMLSADELNQKVDFSSYFEATPAPANPVESIAEFEPMAGVLIAYPLGIPGNLVVKIAQKDTVWVLCKNESEKQEFFNELQQTYNSEMFRFIYAETNSYWTRDYGPMFIAGKDSIGIVNFKYNRDRPDDDKIPEKLSNEFSIPYFSMDVIHTGGNYMTDGYGIAASTPIVYTESQAAGISQEEVDQRMNDYLGIHTYHVVEDPNDTYIDHIDCWGKFLDVDKVLIRSVPESHPQYDEIEEVADYFENQQSSWGNNYQVFRVYTPNNEPYTNSFIINNRVFVPQMTTEWDDEALETYLQAMPGYEVFSFQGNWVSTDAIHCRIHEIADKDMLRIKHAPITGEVETNQDFTVEAEIKAYSQAKLIADSLLFCYQINEEEWAAQQLIFKEENTYKTDLPQFEKGDNIRYYIKAMDKSGKRASYPISGKTGAFTFSIKNNTQIADLRNSIQIKVYPNPASDWLNVSFNDMEKVDITIYNSSGQVIRKLDNCISNQNIFVGGLPGGFYYLKVSSAQFQQTFKISKK